MARIRTIKPEFPQSESMGRVSRDARLLFIMLWTVVDDHGRTRAHPTLLANLLFPYDEDAKLRIPEWLMELERQNCITVYAVENNAYLQIEKWTDHQRIDHPGKSKFPSPPDTLGKSRKKVREPRKNTPRTKEGTKDQGRESSFEIFWKACPKKVGKGAAEQAWDKASKETEPEIIIAGINRFAALQAGKDPTYIAHPATWLNQKRWLDEDDPAPGGAPALRLVSPEMTEAERENLKRLGVI